MSESERSELTEAEQAEREERFRYTDLNHPLMQVLFNMQLEVTSEEVYQP